MIDCQINLKISHQAFLRYLPHDITNHIFPMIWWTCWFPLGWNFNHRDIMKTREKSSSCFHNVSNSYHRSSQSFSYFIQHLPIRGFCVLQENFFMATEAYGWSLLHFIDFLPEARISTQKTLLSTILKLILETWSVGMKRRRLIEQIPGKFENPVASLRTKQDRQINSPGLGNNQQLKAGLFYYRSFLPGRQPRTFPSVSHSIVMGTNFSFLIFGWFSS